MDGRLKALWRLQGGGRGRLASSFVGADQAYQKREAVFEAVVVAAFFFLVARDGKGAAPRGSLLVVVFVSRCLCRARCLLFVCLVVIPNSVSGR